MGMTLSLIRMYGYKIKAREDDEDDAPPDDDDLLDKATGASGDYSARHDARKALGVEFELYSWGDEMPRALAITESMATVYDDGIMPADMPPVGAEWRAMLDRVVAACGLIVDGEPRWYMLARYF